MTHYTSADPDPHCRVMGTGHNSGCTFLSATEHGARDK